MKYYPDKFYVDLSGIDNINDVDFVFSNPTQEPLTPYFYHEYFHYLTNITSLAGIRQFHLNFCDKVRIVTRLLTDHGLDAFPINEKQEGLSFDLNIKDWLDSEDILSQDDIQSDLSRKLNESYFRVTGAEVYSQQLTAHNAQQRGEWFRVCIRLEGSAVDYFNLTFGDIDEFLSTSIDEYFFEFDLNCIDQQTFRERPEYPYKVFDKIISSVANGRRLCSIDKILISYSAIHSYNPPVVLYKILQSLHTDHQYNKYKKNREYYIINLIKKDLVKSSCVSIDLIEKLKLFSEECNEQKRRNLGGIVTSFSEVFSHSLNILHDDFFFFVRPFLKYSESNDKGTDERSLLYNELSSIVKQVPSPSILHNKQLYCIDFGGQQVVANHVPFLVVLYDVINSTSTSSIYKVSEKFSSKFDIAMLAGLASDKYSGRACNMFFHALNELSLAQVYMNESAASELA